MAKQKNSKGVGYYYKQGDYFLLETYPRWKTYRQVCQIPERA